MVSHSKYDGLVFEATLSAPELEMAIRSARAKLVDIEDILVSEFNLKPQQIGAALARYFNVPYEPFRPGRIKPVFLLKNLKAQYVEENHWLPLDEDKNGLLVLALDPERIKASRIVNQVFPKSQVTYCVTTRSEFKRTMDQFFGTSARSDGSSLRELLSGMANEDESEEAARVSEAVETELVKLINKVIMDAYRRRVRHPHRAAARQRPHRHPLSQGWHAGAVYRHSVELPQRAGGARQNHVRPRHLGAA